MALVTMGGTCGSLGHSDILLCAMGEGEEFTDSDSRRRDVALLSKSRNNGSGGPQPVGDRGGGMSLGSKVGVALPDPRELVSAVEAVGDRGPTRLDILPLAEGLEIPPDWFGARTLVRGWPKSAGSVCTCVRVNVTDLK